MLFNFHIGFRIQLHKGNADGLRILQENQIIPILFLAGSLDRQINHAKRKQNYSIIHFRYQKHMTMMNGVNRMICQSQKRITQK